MYYNFDLNNFSSFSNPNSKNISEISRWIPPSEICDGTNHCSPYNKYNGSVIDEMDCEVPEGSIDWCPGNV